MEITLKTLVDKIHKAHNVCEVLLLGFFVFVFFNIILFNPHDILHAYMKRLKYREVK